MTKPITIREAVTRAVATMPGNKPFRALELPRIVHEQGDDDGYLSGDQVSRALRELPPKPRLTCRCRVKGRRVP